jgi:hypothetical protein
VSTFLFLSFLLIAVTNILVFSWDANFDMIRRKGTIVALGNASGVIPPINIMQLKPKNVKLCRPM